LINLQVNNSSFSTDDLLLKDSHIADDSALFTYQSVDKQFRIESAWQLCNQTGIWSRKDRISNAGSRDIYLSRYLERFVSTPGNYEMFSQEAAGVMKIREYGNRYITE